jgi:site-specific recombinase XerD
MITLIRQPNGYIYLYCHQGFGDNPLKISTKLQVPENLWDNNTRRPTDKKYTWKGKIVTTELNRLSGILEDAIAECRRENITGHDDIKKRYADKAKIVYSFGQKVVIDFLKYFEEYVEGLKENGNKNWKFYQTSLNMIKEYFGHKKPSFLAIDMKFYNSFSSHLKKKNLSVNSISNVWKHIKVVMKRAKEIDKLHSNEDYARFERHREQTDSIYLTLKELDDIYNLKLTGHLDKARDYFIVGAFTGLRFADWDRVSNSAIKDGILSIRSQKTNELSLIPIHYYVQNILNKYNGTLPEKPSNQKMNEYIKLVAEKAKIKEIIEVRTSQGDNKVFTKFEKHELVTTHTARRSLATNLVLKGVSPYVIMKITGHKQLDTFETYVRLNELNALIEVKDLDFFKPPKEPKKKKARKKKETDENAGKSSTTE